VPHHMHSTQCQVELTCNLQPVDTCNSSRIQGRHEGLREERGRAAASRQLQAAGSPLFLYSPHKKAASLSCHGQLIKITSRAAAWQAEREKEKSMSAKTKGSCQLAYMLTQTHFLPFLLTLLLLAGRLQLSSCHSAYFSR